MLLARTEQLDVHRNLALEECLLEQAVERGPALFLWRSSGAVVIGKNQNPWREVNLPELQAAGLVLARRCSGGGTVFHDAGNLNYALALPRDTYDQDALFEKLIQSFRRAGIPATRGPHHGLLVQGRKFSGSAFCIRRRAVLHHGTLLIRADLGRMQRVLTGGLALSSRAIASYPMPVINLSDVQPACDIERVVIAAYAPHATAAGDDFLETLQWREKAEGQRTWDWQFGQTPPFEVKLADATVRVEHGRIAEVTGNAALAAKLVGQMFQGLPELDGVKEQTLI